MTLEELRYLFVDEDQPVRLYDLNNDAKVVYQGPFSDIPEEFEGLEISSIDAVYKAVFDGYIGININLEEEV